MSFINNNHSQFNKSIEAFKACSDKISYHRESIKVGSEMGFFTKIFTAVYYGIAIVREQYRAQSLLTTIESQTHFKDSFGSHHKIVVLTQVSQFKNVCEIRSLAHNIWPHLVTSSETETETNSETSESSSSSSLESSIASIEKNIASVKPYEKSLSLLGDMREYCHTLSSEKTNESKLKLLEKIYTQYESVKREILRTTLDQTSPENSEPTIRLEEFEQSLESLMTKYDIKSCFLTILKESSIDALKQLQDIDEKSSCFFTTKASLELNRKTIIDSQDHHEILASAKQAHASLEFAHNEEVDLELEPTLESFFSDHVETSLKALCQQSIQKGRKGTLYLKNLSEVLLETPLKDEYAFLSLEQVSNIQEQIALSQETIKKNSEEAFSQGLLKLTDSGSFSEKELSFLLGIASCNFDTHTFILDESQQLHRAPISSSPLLNELAISTKQQLQIFLSDETHHHSQTILTNLRDCSLSHPETTLKMLESHSLDSNQSHLLSSCQQMKTLLKLLFQAQSLASQFENGLEGKSQKDLKKLSSFLENLKEQHANTSSQKEFWEPFFEKIEIAILPICNNIEKNLLTIDDVIAEKQIEISQIQSQFIEDPFAESEEFMLLTGLIEAKKVLITRDPPHEAMSHKGKAAYEQAQTFIEKQLDLVVTHTHDHITKSQGSGIEPRQIIKSTDETTRIQTSLPKNIDQALHQEQKRLESILKESPQQSGFNRLVRREKPTTKEEAQRALQQIKNLRGPNAILSSSIQELEAIRSKTPQQQEELSKLTRIRSTLGINPDWRSELPRQVAEIESKIQKLNRDLSNLNKTRGTDFASIAERTQQKSQLEMTIANAEFDLEKIQLSTNYLNEFSMDSGVHLMSLGLEDGQKIVGRYNSKHAPEKDKLHELKTSIDNLTIEHRLLFDQLELVSSIIDQRSP